MTAVPLSPQQSEIADIRDGAILVEAGPGSGKTRVLTERIRRLITRGDGTYRVLALTFTNKAAQEMRTRLEGTIPDVDDHVYVGTIHGFCLHVLTERGKVVGIEGGPTIFDSAEDRKRVMKDATRHEPRLLEEIGRRCRSVEDEHKLLKEWLRLISETKKKLQRPEQIRRSDPVLATAYEAYDTQMRASRALDYDDLLLLTHRIFTERPEIAAFYRRLYRYVCIDEAQDLNEAQYQLLQSFCGQDFRNIMLVGDPRQNIYVWQGSHHKYLDQFQHDFQARRLTLTENFRSAKKIIRAATKLAASVGGPNEAVTPREGEVRAFSLPDEEAEAEFVITNALRLIEQGHPEIEKKPKHADIAILARNGYLLNPIAKRFDEAGIPYFKRISTEDSFQSDLLRELDLLLRLTANPRDRLHYDLLMESWGVADNTGPLLAPGGIIDMARMNDRLPALPPRARAELDAIKATGDPEFDFELTPALDVLTAFANTLPEPDEKAAALEDIELLGAQWRAFLRVGPGGRRRLVSFLANGSLNQGQPPREEGIALLTVHSAKGLEFSAVFLIGFAQGTFPDYRAQTQAQIEEEQRNAYVAITRAMRVCFITFPRERMMPWGDKRAQQPSAFLELMGLSVNSRTK